MLTKIVPANRRDVRTQADPQDFETTMRRPAKPPVDAFWQGGNAFGSDLDWVLRIQDWDEPSNRYANVKYRMYFLGLDPSNASDPVLSSMGLKGAFRGASLMGEVPCSGRGGYVDVMLYQYQPIVYWMDSHKDGWLFIVGVNRFGDESESMSPVRMTMPP